MLFEIATAIIIESKVELFLSFCSKITNSSVKWMIFQIAAAVKIALDFDAIWSNGCNADSWMLFKKVSCHVIYLTSILLWREYCNLRVIVWISSVYVMQPITHHCHIYNLFDMTSKPSTLKLSKVQMLELTLSTQ